MTTAGTPDGLTVRRVTDVHANWSDHGGDRSGRFSYQLILDDGALETVVFPSAADAYVLGGLLGATGDQYFDTARRELIFGGISLDPRKDIP